MKIEFVRDYRFAHRGVEVVEYTAGQILEASDELSEIAVADGAAKPVKERAKKAEVDQAPEVK